MYDPTMTVDEIVIALELIRHDEGGWFKETYRSEATAQCPDRDGTERPLLTTIHYLLGGETPSGLLHSNRSDIVHFHEAGASLRYVLLHPGGTLEEKILGPKGDAQLVVPGGVWKASEVLDGSWGMVGEAVSPGFDYRDRELASKEVIIENFPQHAGTLDRFLR